MSEMGAWLVDLLTEEWLHRRSVSAGTDAWRLWSRVVLIS
jgi:hypothetical protein